MVCPISKPNMVHSEEEHTFVTSVYLLRYSTDLERNKVQNGG